MPQVKQIEQGFSVVVVVVDVVVDSVVFGLVLQWYLVEGVVGT